MTSKTENKRGHDTRSLVERAIEKAKSTRNNYESESRKPVAKWVSEIKKATAE